MFITRQGEPHPPWRAVDEHHATLDMPLQKRRDKAAAKRFFERALRSNPVPRKIVNQGREHFDHGKVLFQDIWLGFFRANICNRNDVRGVLHRRRSLLSIIGTFSGSSYRSAGFKYFRCARTILSDTEVMHMKSQKKDDVIARTATE